MIEKRVYVVDFTQLTDEEQNKLYDKTVNSNALFMDYAEQQGTVYTLEGFEHAFNYEEVDTCCHQIRMLDVEVYEDVTK